MANNHQGSVAHAKKIIESFGELAKRKKLNAAIKFQFRQLDTFIHDEYKDSDLKFVKRFSETRLSKKDFSALCSFAKSNGLKTIATPFDNDSIQWIEDLDIDAVKIASCSIDDWPLLKHISKVNRKIVISTAGATMEHLKKVHSLFNQKGRNFSFMHCVGEYPTPHDVADLNRINRMKEEFPDVEIGFSTHESPDEKSVSPYAVAMGCTILEKHVGVETSDIKLNKYSNTPEQMLTQIEEIEFVQRSLSGRSSGQGDTLKNLKRGVYYKRDMKKGSRVTVDDVYYAMPVVDGQFDASSVDDEWGWVKRSQNIVGSEVSSFVKKDAPVMKNDLYNPVGDNERLKEIVSATKSMLRGSGVTVTNRDNVEISCHYGIENFEKTGAVIIDKVNREYCKKIIVMQPEQSHPSHFHTRKEESFELLAGDCVLTLNGKDVRLSKGVPLLIARGVEHSFQSLEGCVIEEISTTHYKGDSTYTDPEINKLSLADRKIKIIVGDKDE